MAGLKRKENSFMWEKNFLCSTKFMHTQPVDFFFFSFACAHSVPFYFFPPQWQVQNLWRIAARGNMYLNSLLCFLCESRHSRRSFTLLEWFGSLAHTTTKFKCSRYFHPFCPLCPDKSGYINNTFPSFRSAKVTWEMHEPLHLQYLFSFNVTSQYRVDHLSWNPV